MKYSATAKYVRMSPRKVRLMARAVSGKSVRAVLSALMMRSKVAAEPIRKVLLAAVDSAKQKKAKEETLVVESIDVMGGPVMKRWHAVSRGSAHGYKKRMSHVKVVLKEQENVVKRP